MTKEDTRLTQAEQSVHQVYLEKTQQCIDEILEKSEAHAKENGGLTPKEIAFTDGCMAVLEAINNFSRSYMHD
mgnify:CR=1 FL=1